MLAALMHSFFRGWGNGVLSFMWECRGEGKFQEVPALPGFLNHFWLSGPQCAAFKCKIAGVFSFSTSPALFSNLCSLIANGSGCNIKKEDGKT
jgi:hypothetical protein